MSFDSLGLSASLVKMLSDNNFELPYPIQSEAIPHVLQGKDVLGIAKTGSGKTAAYALPILANLDGNLDSRNRHVDVLVVVPTRELAMQVKDVFQSFSVGIPTHIKAMAVFGGVSINPQMKMMRGTNVLVATPGRLIELLEKNALQLAGVKTLVLDEADKMLNEGFRVELDRILAKLPKRRQNLLFSATLSPNIESINRLLLKDPVVVNVDGVVAIEAPVETSENTATEAPKEEVKASIPASAEPALEQIKQLAYIVKEEKKGPLLRYLIKEHAPKQMLVFVSSSHSADAVVFKLRGHDINAAAIHGKKSQGSRTDSLTKFKNGKLQVLVATDLLSRGVDIEKLPIVVNYELPRSPKDFVHRIGRTGRADASGEAFSLITEADEHHFKVIQKKMKRWVDRIDAANINLQGY